MGAHQRRPWMGTSPPEKAMHGCMDGNTPEKALDGNDNIAQKGFDPGKTTKNALGGNNKKNLMKQERLFRDTMYTNQLLEIEKRPIYIKANQARSHENDIVCVWSSYVIL